MSAGGSVEGSVDDPGPGRGQAEPTGADLAAALAHTHLWFEVNSGWAPPDEETLIDWGLEGIGRAPDDCLVAERGTCRHGLASWQVVLDDLADHDELHFRHRG